MSGIFGVFDLDGWPAPDTSCTVWADARLDYRSELLSALDLKNAFISDADLILAAYKRWGETCVDHLRGDFAFAILDPREQKLFCGRDHFGMRPFYYHHAPGKRFVFASDAREIFAVAEVPFAINEGRVADFIVPELEWIDYDSTFYEGVFRLPPGHSMTVTMESLRLSEYWEPKPGPELGPMSDHDWRDGFLEVFTRAVAERLRGGTTGVMLSGGMDSGSVAAVAADLLRQRGDGPLRTVSAVSPNKDCVESNRVRATSDFLGTSATMIGPDELGELDDTLIASIEEPFDAEFLFMKAIFVNAHERGLKALLDGGGGDIVLSEGTYIARLIRRGKLATAFREIAAEPMFWGGGSVAREVFRYLGQAATPGFIKNATRPSRQRAGAKRFVETSMINREFAQRVNIEVRCDRMHRLFPTGHADYALERVQKIRPNVSAGRERYARLARFSGVEARDPFLDLRVIEFCSRMPPHLLVHDGWPKYILREAMAGKLPDGVRWGTGKPHIGWTFNESFCYRERARGNLSIDRLQASLDGFVNPEKLELAWQHFKGNGDSGPVHSAYVLALWLEQNVNRPTVKAQKFG